MDAIYNWTNHLIPDTKGQMERIASKINTRLSQGFNMEEAVDLLIGEEDLTAINKVVDYMLLQEREENLNETKTSSTSGKIPVKYADIQDDIASLLKQMKPEEFIETFANKNSLISLSNKKQDELKELLWYAKRHPSDSELMGEVHGYIQPYIDQAIQDSQILAQNNSFKFKKVAEQLYKVKDENGTYQVDIEHKTCTCPRYILCGFNLIGLTCEHILGASKNFDNDFVEDAIGHKTVFAHKYNNDVRTAWCDRAQDEIMIEKSCVESNCPFLKQDQGDKILCSFC